MSTVAPTPEITVNTPAAEIAAANQASQASPTPGQPRNPDGTFAAPPPAPVAAPAPASTQPYTVENLDGGKVRVKFADLPEVYEGTYQELLPKISDALYKTKQWGYGLNQQLKTVQQPATPPAPPAAPQSPFTDPAEAATANYVLDLVAKRMGLPNGDALVNSFGHIESNTTDYASQTTALAFQAAQPDFNPTPENSDKLLSVIDQSGIGPAFESASREQQVQMLRQAHAYCLMAKIYDAKPQATSNPTVPAPPPPAPTGERAAITAGELPAELRAAITDTPEQIKAKWDKARSLGYAV